MTDNLYSCRVKQLHIKLVTMMKAEKHFLLSIAKLPNGHLLLNVLLLTSLSSHLCFGHSGTYSELNNKILL